MPQPLLPAAAPDASLEDVTDAAEAVTAEEVAALRECVAYHHVSTCPAVTGPTLLLDRCACRVGRAQRALAKLTRRVGAARPT